MIAFDATTASEELIAVGYPFAEALGLAPTVLFVETPGAPADGAAADLLGTAAQMGAAVAKAPAPDLLSGASAYAELSPVKHVVLPALRRRKSRWRQEGAADRLDGLEGRLDVTTVTIQRGGRARETRAAVAAQGVSAASYGWAIAATLATVPPLLLLRSLIGAQALGFLFVVPVLGVAARTGFGPALLSALLSTLCYDLLVLKPGARFGAIAPQDLVVASALILVAIYASALTARLRERASLSDRSAQENASLAAFGVSLTRVSDWESTATLVCAEVARMFGVHAAVFREVDGKLARVAAEPAAAILGPVDRTALDWTWERGEAAGSGTSAVAAADWQFHPLETSLGRLAVVAIARDDGRSPVAEHRKLLLQTVLAQAALAHERLRLEDQIRADASDRLG